MQEFVSPSNWRWWVSKCNVKASHKFTAGRFWNYTCYICAPCRQDAWEMAKETVAAMPRDAWYPQVASDFFDSFSRECARKAFRRMTKLEDAEVDYVRIWVDAHRGD